ncbi:hypothetical protein Mal33_33110 [Rosistilla oblonga]|uniref:DUF1549 domain-containing protein n=2 Tax=Rosistilla oblonga TaxID=2527990 RepID=A0A518IW56_9BACT|nr:hypothetical protein Mal33_33110 [Rosistilla oblonga]
MNRQRAPLWGAIPANRPVKGSGMDRSGLGWLEWGASRHLPNPSPPIASRMLTSCRYLLGMFLASSVLMMHASRADQPSEGSGDLFPVAKINDFVSQAWEERGVNPAARCDDRQFVRRVYLDLAGRVPTIEESDAFANDTQPDKRAALVDRLLASEDYPQHFADLFDALLMGRTNEGKYKQRANSGWRKYLEDVFRKNRPWDEVAAEVLLARPEDKAKRGAVWFLYERNDQHQAIAEAVAPAFFGIRIECAQCHDHMVVNEIEQAHYWGLVAFFNRSKNAKTKEGLRVAESAIGGFSDFANLEGDSTPNLLTFLGASTVEEPRPAGDAKQEDADDLYATTSEDPANRIPKFSRRQRFVEDVLRDHPLLARSMVNRLWAIMLGRGIVHPFDEMDSVHPPSHPELLDWLATEFAESNYDIRSLVRSLALSDAYQLDSRQPVGVDDPASFAWYLERRLTGEQLARSIQLIAEGKFTNDVELIKQFRQQISDVLLDETVVGVDDTLFLTNGRGLDNYLRSSRDKAGLLAELNGSESHRQRAERLFQSVFLRAPDGDETKAVVDYLNARNDDLPAALQQVLWSMINSAEFQFNH